MRCHCLDGRARPSSYTAGTHVACVPLEICMGNLTRASGPRARSRASKIWHSDERSPGFVVNVIR
jgi:hypothetical protein